MTHSLHDSFEHYTDDEIAKYLVEHCNIKIWKRLEDGSISGVVALIYTVAICNNILPKTPFSYRWCFEDIEEAKIFYKSLRNFDDIPTQIKSLRGHRYLTSPLLELRDENGFPRWK